MAEGRFIRPQATSGSPVQGERKGADGGNIVSPRQRKRPPRGRRPLRQGERRSGRISPSTVFASPARFPSAYSGRRGAGCSHVAREGRRMCGEVLRRTARDAARRSRARRGRGSPRRTRSRGRRCRLPPRRRARDRLHRRLLPAARRRSPHVRSDRGDECPERRVRNGRSTAAGAVCRRVPGGAPGRDARRGAGRRRGEGARVGRDPRGRSHDPRHRAEVRPRGRRHRAPETDLAEGWRQARRGAPPDEASRNGHRPPGAA